MKKTWLIFALLTGLCFSVNGADDVRALKLVGRDYSLLDVSARPVSIGVTYLDCEDVPHGVGLIGSLAFLQWQEHLRLEAGAVGTWCSSKDRLQPYLTTGIGMLFDNVVFQVWYAPFWNLYGGSDDPWGISLGYAINIEAVVECLTR